MAQWSNKNNANSAPKFVTNATTGQTGIQEFGTAVFGVKSADAETHPGAASPGWVRTITGAGTLNAVELDDGGEDYANTSVFTVKDGSTTLGTGTVVTDGTGEITSINYTAVSSKVSGTPAVTWDANTVGTGATFTFDISAGRQRSETIVAMRNIS